MTIGIQSEAQLVIAKYLKDPGGKRDRVKYVTIVYNPKEGLVPNEDGIKILHNRHSNATPITIEEFKKIADEGVYNRVLGEFENPRVDIIRLKTLSRKAEVEQTRPKPIGEGVIVTVEVRVKHRIL